MVFTTTKRLASTALSTFSRLPCRFWVKATRCIEYAYASLSETSGKGTKCLSANEMYTCIAQSLNPRNTTAQINGGTIKIHYMNTRIARCLNEARIHTEQELKTVAVEIVDTHNRAVKFGLIELPMLLYTGIDNSLDEETAILVVPRSGLINLNELYNLQSAWGADRIEVCNTNGFAICLCFNKE